MNIHTVNQHARQRLTKTPVQEHPFPHFFVKNVFPNEYHQKILENWPKTENLSSIADSGHIDPGSYRERHFMSLMRPSTEHATSEPHSQLQIVQDCENHNIGPHTDAPHRPISNLLFCPSDFSQCEIGTSLYEPHPNTDIQRKIPSTHYSHKDFLKTGTAPFIPNSLFSFVITPKFFHGVEKNSAQEENVQRNLILHFVRWKTGKDKGEAL